MSYVLTHPTPSNWDHEYSILSGRIGPNEPSPDYMHRFDEIICDFMREQGVPGAALCVSLHGKQIYRQGYGICRAGQPVSSSAHFRIASISKILTAIGIMRLCEEGTISLYKKVVGRNGILSHIHVSKARQRDIGSITVKHLLEHSGGWDRDVDGDQVFWYMRRPHKNFIEVWNNWSLVMHVLSISLRFPPGTKHAYSNFGYLLLGLVIEKVTKMNYEDYIRSILREVGIEDIFVGNTRQDLVDFREVRYFNNKDPPVEKSVLEPDRRVPPQYGSFPMENSGSYGGWVTSAENLVTLLDCLIMQYDLPNLLSADSVKQMLKKPRSEEEAWYGLGLDIEDRGLSFGHTGAMEGTSTTVHHDNNGLTWSLLMNSWSKDMDLDGLVKFALASIPGLPLWQQTLPGIESTDYFVVSSDSFQCVRILLPHSELENHLKLMKCEGYRISHVNVLTLGHEVLFTFIWQQNRLEQEWGVFIDVDLKELEQYLAMIRLHSIRILYLEPYRLHGKVRHICVFEYCESVEQKISFVRDVLTHESCVKVLTGSGYELRSQSFLYGPKDKVTITAVYERVTLKVKPLQYQRWTNLPIQDFVEQLADATRNKYKLEYLKFCSTPDLPKISAVLSKCRTPKEKLVDRCRHKSCQTNVFQRHDVSKYGFLFELRESMRINRHVLFVSAYESEGVTYFATIWSANTGSNSGKIIRKRGSVTGEHEKGPEVVIDNAESFGEQEKGPDVVIDNAESFGIHCMAKSWCDSIRAEYVEHLESEQIEYGNKADLAALNIKIELAEQSAEEEDRFENVPVKSEAMSDTDTGEESEGAVDDSNEAFDYETVHIKDENVVEDELYGRCIVEPHLMIEFMTCQQENLTQNIGQVP